MKWEPWVSFNFLLICLTCGLLQLRSENLVPPNQPFKKNTSNPYLYINSQLANMISINHQIDNFSEDLKQLKMTDRLGKQRYLKLESTNSGTNLMLDDIVLLKNIVWAKFDRDGSSGIPFILMQLKNYKTLRVNLPYKLTG